jgi:hypothetical protein
VTDEQKVIQFPRNVESIQIDAIVFRAVLFDGNALWLDIYQREAGTGVLVNINKEPVDLRPGSDLTIQFANKPIIGE